MLIKQVLKTEQQQLINASYIEDLSTVQQKLQYIKIKIAAMRWYHNTSPAYIRTVILNNADLFYCNMKAQLVYFSYLIMILQVKFFYRIISLINI